MISNPIVELTQSVQKNIANKNFSLALEQIKKYIEVIISDPLLDGIVLDSKELDTLCLAIGREISKDISVVPEVKRQGKETVLYIATELYLSGGHTAVLEDFIKAQPDCDHVILLTNLFARRADKDSLKKRFEKLPVKLIWCPEKILDLVEKIGWLQKEWWHINPSKIFLFNHHQDVIAIAAAQPGMPGQLFFFHHADYQITLGMHLPHAAHIDFYGFLYKRCREECGIVNNVYYPLVVAENGCKTADSFMQEGNLHTCSSGSMGKYDKPYLYAYFDLLPQILKITNGKHTHIGYLSDVLLERIKIALKDNQISQDKFIYIPWVNNLWSFLLKQGVDLYIASFPIGGGRAAVEVMGAGIPIVFHNNYRAPFLGGAIQYPGALFWRHETELLDFLATLNKEVLVRHSIAARQQYEKHHQSFLLHEAIASPESISMAVSETVLNTSLDKDLIFSDMVHSAIKRDIKLRKHMEERDSLSSILRWLARWLVRFLRGSHRGN